MRKILIHSVLLLGFLGLLVGIYWAIVKLQGPRKTHPGSTASVVSGKVQEDSDVRKKIVLESREVQVSFDSGSKTISLVSPLMIMEKTATGSLLSIKPDLKIAEQLVASLPEPESQSDLKPAQIQIDSKGNIRRIKRGETKIVIDREKTRETLLSILQNAPESATFSVPLKVKETEADMSFDVLRENAGFKVCLAEFETIHKDHSSDVERNVNLALAAEKIDGIVLQPGEEFSFNRVVGERSRKNGFRMAGVISNGRVVPGLGGGICQVSTTLYNSALLANLEIIERHNHSIYEGIPYAEIGRDAAVVWGSKDFRFRNSLKMPILISCRSGKGWVKVGLFAERKPYDKVEVLTRNEIKHPFPIQRKVGKASRTSETKIVRPGVTGYTVETFRIVQIGSSSQEQKLSKDHYQMFPQIEEVSN